MNALKNFRTWTIGAFVLLLFLAPIGVVQAQNPAHLTVTLSGQTLTGGFNSNVTITATNTYIYYVQGVYPSTAIYDVDLAVSVPAPLQMLGDSHWHYDSIELRQSVTITFQVYAPLTAVGNSYQGSVTLTYRQLGDISYTTETHVVGFSVRGWVRLVLYGVLLTPSTAAPGGNATISGNLLNSGNISVYDANVTVESEALAPGSSASLFVGEVDPNIPRPFSLFLNFGKNLADGNYSIIVRVSAIDTNMPASPYNAQQPSQLQIKRPVAQPSGRQRGGGGGVIGMIFEILRYLWSIFSGSTSLPAPPTLAYSYFSATTAFILDARQAG